MNMFFQQPCYVGTIITACLISLESLRDAGYGPETTKFENVFDAYYNLMETLGADSDVISILEIVGGDTNAARRQVRFECMTKASNAVTVAAEQRVGRESSTLELGEYNKIVRSFIPSGEEMAALISERHEKLSQAGAVPGPCAGFGAILEALEKMTVPADNSTDTPDVAPNA